jgi:hypothetical protein
VCARVCPKVSSMILLQAPSGQEGAGPRVYQRGRGAGERAHVYMCMDSILYNDIRVYVLIAYESVSEALEQASGHK